MDHWASKLMLTMFVCSLAVFVVSMDLLMFTELHLGIDMEIVGILLVMLGVYVFGIVNLMGSFHAGRGVIPFIICVTIEVVRGLVDEGPLKYSSWCLTSFVVAHLSFFALVAPPEVCADISRILCAREFALFVRYHIGEEKSAAYASLVSSIMCLVIMFSGVGRLLFVRGPGLEGFRIDVFLNWPPAFCLCVLLCCLAFT